MRHKVAQLQVLSRYLLTATLPSVAVAAPDSPLHFRANLLQDADQSKASPA